MKTLISVDHRLPSNFDRTTFDDPTLVEKFEAGRLIVIDDFPLNIDLDFIQSIQVPDPKRENKKLKGKHLVEALKERSYPKHVIHNLGLSYDDAKRFQEIVKDVERQIREYIDCAFPGYRLQSLSDISWRLNTSRDEAMHFDNYFHPETFYIRMFYNLDTEPRIWRTSYDIKTAFVRTRELMNLDRFCVDPPKLAVHLAHCQFGPDRYHESSNRDMGFNYPRHEFRFAPGAMWMVYSQFQSHQIEYGNKMAAFGFRVEKSSMRNPALCFDEIFERLWETEQ